MREGHPGRLSRAAGLVPLAVFFAACTQLRYTEAFYPEGEVTRIEILSDAGVVELNPGDRLRVERGVRGPEGGLSLSHGVVDGVLTLEARCRALVPCAVDTAVNVPAGVEVVVSLGRGEIWATGLQALSIDLGQGEADLAVQGDLDVRVGSGDVRASLTQGCNARISVADGDLDLTVSEGPWRVEASADELDSRGVVERDDATSTLDLLAPGGRIVLRAVPELAGV